jgi:hypothetical protein
MFRKIPTSSENHPDTDDSDKIIIDFQALFIPDSASRINMILPQLAFNDVKDIVLLGTNLWHHESLPGQTKGYNRQTVITDGYFGSSRKPATAGLKTRSPHCMVNLPDFWRRFFMTPPGCCFPLPWTLPW